MSKQEGTNYQKNDNWKINSYEEYFISDLNITRNMNEMRNQS